MGLAVTTGARGSKGAAVPLPAHWGLAWAENGGLCPRRARLAWHIPPSGAVRRGAEVFRAGRWLGRESELSAFDRYPGDLGAARHRFGGMALGMLLPIRGARRVVALHAPPNAGTGILSGPPPPKTSLEKGGGTAKPWRRVSSSVSLRSPGRRRETPSHRLWRRQPPFQGGLDGDPPIPAPL